MKVRTFKKCINRKRDYRYFPHYTHSIFCIGLGEDTKYMCGKMRAWRENRKWRFGFKYRFDPDKMYNHFLDNPSGFMRLIDEYLPFK